MAQGTPMGRYEYDYRAQCDKFISELEHRLGRSLSPEERAEVLDEDTLGLFRALDDAIATDQPAETRERLMAALRAKAEEE